MSNDSSRREFVLLCSGAILALTSGVRRRTRQPASCHHHIRQVTHPEPRPGITAAKVLPNEKLTEHPDAVTSVRAGAPDPPDRGRHRLPLRLCNPDRLLLPAQLL